MDQRPNVDRLLSTWSEDAYSPPAPAYLSKVLERTQRTRQRHAWASLERWLPMTVTTDRPAAPRRAAARLDPAHRRRPFVLAAGIAIVGSRLLEPPPALPLGGAAVIAFTSQDGGETEPLVGDLYTVRADGTDLRQLTMPPSTAGIDQSPLWSPDGTRIVFRNFQEATDSVEVIDAGGGNRTTLWTGGAGRDVYCSEHDDSAWSPDGQTVVFAAHEAVPRRAQTCSSSRPTGRPRLRCCSSGHERRVPEVLAPTADGSPSWAVRAAAPAASTWPSWDRLAPARAAFRPVGSVPISKGSPGEQWFPPQWSPDGTELAVAVGPFDNGRDRRRQGRRFRPARPGDATRRPTRPGRLTASASRSTASWMSRNTCRTGRAPCASG